MEVTLLGTGCPQCDTSRFGPASLVRYGNATVLVDCGSGVTQRLLGAGSSGAAVDAVLLTHLHSDHLVDLYQLLVSGWHQGRDRPLRVYGPPGTRRHVEGLLALWQPERRQRLAHERRPSAAGFEAEVTEFSAAGALLELGGLAVEAVQVDHAPVEHAYGFVFRTAGRVAAFSGDTRYCERLIAAARGADLLVHECFIHREMLPKPGIRTAEGIAAVASYHTAAAEVGKVAAQAQVEFLMLNHFVPTRFDRAALAGEIAAEYDGPFAIGEDLMRYDLGTGELEYREMRCRVGRRP